MGPAAETVILYTAIILYLFLKFVVIYHALKFEKSTMWAILVLLPLADFYYYFKYAKVKK